MGLGGPLRTNLENLAATVAANRRRRVCFGILRHSEDSPDIRLRAWLLFLFASFSSFVNEGMDLFVR